jgi:tetratricopeptide (TPR) repeat protein
MSYRARTYLRLPHSLAELISQLCLFERDAPFFIIQSVLWYAAYAYPLIFIISYQAKDRLQRAVESIFLGWFGLAVLSCALLQYRPSRYMLFIIPPLAVLAALSLTFLADLPAALGRIRLARWHTLLFFFWGIPLLYRWAFPLFEQVKAAYPTSSIPGNEYVRLFGAGLGSALLLLLCATLWRKFGPPPNSVGSESLARAGSFSRTFALALLGLTLIFNGYPYLAWAFQPYYSAYQTSRDLGELLPGSSKLGGGYAHYLSLETTFPADRLAVAAEELCDALENRRVTHILIDTREGVQKIRTPTGEPLPCLRYLHTFYVRGYGIQLYRAISSESKIGPSPFESAMRLSQQKKWAEALPIFQILAAEHPANSTILTRLGIGLWQTGKLREAATNLERANAINGRNPDTLLTLARIYQLESRARDKQQRLLGEAYESALNEPGMKQYITALLKKF